MKKLILTGITVFCIICFYAEGQSAVGMKTGVNLSNFLVNESAQIKSTAKTGVSVGNFYKHQLREYVVMEIDVIFHYQTSGIKDLTTETTAEYQSLGMEIPLYGMLQVELKHDILYMGFGPFASIGLISRCEADGRNINPYKKDNLSGKAMMHRWDFGAGFIAGYELRFGLQFNFNYHLGFRSMLDTTSYTATMTSRIIELGVGYRF